jgi:dihydroxyacid dehydratase/phosphogluconate dehydratase
MNHQGVKFVIVVAIVVLGTTKVTGQTSIPEILLNGTLSEQMNYVESKTMIYENYRAIREDMFQKLKNNAVDSLTKARNNIAGFVVLTGNLNLRIDSLENNLNVKKDEVKELTRTKNNIRVFGTELNNFI